MTGHKKPGELILNNLQTFNEATCFFEKHVESKIYEGIDGCIESFSTENSWDGNFQFKGKEDNWLRPRNWENENGLEAWFAIGSTESTDDDNYWLSLFCKVASNSCEAGFFFGVETKYFGGTPTWKARLRNIQEDHKTRLLEIGFKQFDGNFFLPIELENEALAKSWREKDDPYTPDDPCFEPLRVTLEKLKQSVPIFEAIMGIDPTPRSY